MTKRRNLLIQVVVGASALVLLASSVSVAAVRVSRDEPDAADLLAEARSFVVENQTVSFRAETRQESNFGGFEFGEEADPPPPEEATTVVNRAVVEGSIAEPDRARSTTRSGGFRLEAIQVAGDVWTRFAESAEELSERKWTELGMGSEEFGEGPGGGGLDGYGGFFGLAPTDESDIGSLTRLIDRTVSPTIVSRKGDETVVRADLGPRPVAPSGVKEVERGTVVFTLADDGRPVRAVISQTLEIEGEDDFPGFRVDSSTDHTFTGWGEPVDIEAPAGDEIDLTPYVEEEAIADFQDAPLYQPRGIPTGWVLESADIMASYSGDEGCDQLELDYTDPDDESYGYLYLTELSLECADVEAPPEAGPFTAGSNRGWILSDDDGYVYAQIVVGRTVIEADTDLSVDALRRVLSQLRPLDFSVEPDPITGLRSSAGTPA